MVGCTKTSNSLLRNRRIPIDYVAHSQWARSLTSSHREPEVARENTGLAEPFSRTQVDDVPANGQGGVGHGDGRSVPNRLSLGVPPQVIHRVQFRGGPG